MNIFLLYIFFCLVMAIPEPSIKRTTPAGSFSLFSGRHDIPLKNLKCLCKFEEKN